MDSVLMATWIGHLHHFRFPISTWPIPWERTCLRTSLTAGTDTCVCVFVIKRKELKRKSISIFSYRDFRATTAPNYEPTLTFWNLLAARLAFVILFEHLLFFIVALIQWLIPDVPKDVENRIKHEQFLDQQARWKPAQHRSRHFVLSKNRWLGETTSSMLFQRVHPLNHDWKANERFERVFFSIDFCRKIKLATSSNEKVMLNESDRMCMSDWMSECTHVQHTRRVDSWIDSFVITRLTFTRVDDDHYDQGNYTSLPESTMFLTTIEPINCLFSLVSECSLVLIQGSQERTGFRHRFVSFPLSVRTRKDPLLTLGILTRTWLNLSRRQAQLSSGAGAHRPSRRQQHVKLLLLLSSLRISSNHLMFEHLNDEYVASYSFSCCTNAMWTEEEGERGRGKKRLNYTLDVAAYLNLFTSSRCR